jgi:hypothetical protein
MPESGKRLHGPMEQFIMDRIKKIKHGSGMTIGLNGMRIALVKKAEMPGLCNGAGNERVRSQNYPGV